MVGPEDVAKVVVEAATARRPRTRYNQHVPTDRRSLLHLRRATAALAILDAA